jgi:hypothetical protein
LIRHGDIESPEFDHSVLTGRKLKDIKEGRLCGGDRASSTLREDGPAQRGYDCRSPTTAA